MRLRNNNHNNSNIKQKEKINITENQINQSKKTIINIQNMDLSKQQKANLFSKFNQRSFSVIAKFSKPVYLISFKKEISGIVIFKVRAANITFAIYKINLYLKKYAVDKDLKYNIIKVES